MSFVIRELYMYPARGTISFSLPKHYLAEPAQTRCTAPEAISGRNSDRFPSQGIQACGHDCAGTLLCCFFGLLPAGINYRDCYIPSHLANLFLLHQATVGYPAVAAFSFSDPYRSQPRVRPYSGRASLHHKTGNRRRSDGSHIRNLPKCGRRYGYAGCSDRSHRRLCRA